MPLVAPRVPGPGAAYVRAITRIVTAIAFCTLTIIHVGCVNDNPAVVGLLEQIPELEPAGPWRVVIGGISLPEQLGSPEAPRVFDLIPDGELFALTDSTGRLEFDVRVHPGETLVGLLRFGKGQRDAGSVSVSLLGGGGETDTEVHAGKRPAEFRLPAPPDGATLLRLAFASNQTKRAPGMTIWAVATPAPRDGRIPLMLHARAAAFKNLIPELLYYKRASVEWGGNTRDCVVLVPGDTLVFDVPTPTRDAQLQCWPITLCGSPKLAVEALLGDRWESIGTWNLGTTDSLRWNEVRASSGGSRPWSRLRFFLSGAIGSDVAALGEPLLMTRGRARLSKYNLILIDLDTTRADRLGCYGYETRPTSTSLDSMLDAKGFFVFRRAYSAGPHTLPATAKFMTSRYLNIHRAHTVPRHNTTLAEVLRSAGYYCAAFTSGAILRSPGFEQGFHEYHWSTQSGVGKVEDVFPTAREWLADAALSPFFLFVHTYESHIPYTRDRYCRGLPCGRLGDLSKGETLFPSGAERWAGLSSVESLYVQAAYDGGVAEACDATADLFRSLDELRLWSRTIVVVLSDHGEEFWEHSDRYAGHHPASVYGELLNVPFLLYAPGLRGGTGLRIDAPVSTVDLLPTVCDLLGVPTPEPCDGVSLRPLLERRPLDRRTPILATNDHEDRASTRRACLIQGHAKYVESFCRGHTGGRGDGSDPYPLDPALFFLDKDPREAQNLFGDSPSIAELMSESLHAALSRAVKPHDADSQSGGFNPSNELQEQLRVLGYVEGP